MILKEVMDEMLKEVNNHQIDPEINKARWINYKTILYDAFAIDILEFPFYKWKNRWYDFINPFSVFRFQKELREHINTNWKEQ